MNRAAARIRSTFAAVEPCGPAFVARVLAHLDAADPEARGLFPASDAAANARLFSLLTRIVKSFDRFGRLEGPLMDLGSKAARVGAAPRHYASVRQATLATLREVMGAEWNTQVESDWSVMLQGVSGAMLRGAIPVARAA